MADYLQATVRFLHILFGSFWVGVILYQHVVLATFRRMPPPIGGAAMLALGKRGAPAGLGAGVLTIVLGVWNQYLLWGKLDYQSSTAFVALGVALACAVALVVLGFTVQLPTLRQVEALAPKGPPPPGAPPAPNPAMMALQKRMGIVLMVATVLVLTALAMMIVSTLARSGIL